MVAASVQLQRESFRGVAEARQRDVARCAVRCAELGRLAIGDPPVSDPVLTIRLDLPDALVGEAFQSDRHPIHLWVTVLLNIRLKLVLERPGPSLLPSLDWASPIKQTSLQRLRVVVGVPLQRQASGGD